MRPGEVMLCAFLFLVLAALMTWGLTTNKKEASESIKVVINGVSYRCTKAGTL